MDRAAVQKFMIDHLGDACKCRDFIKKYKDDGRYDPDREAARSFVAANFRTGESSSSSSSGKKDPVLKVGMVRKYMDAGRGLAATRISTGDANPRVKISMALNQDQTDKAREEDSKKTSALRSDKACIDMQVEILIGKGALKKGKSPLVIGDDVSITLTKALEGVQTMDAGGGYIVTDKTKMIFVDVMVLFAELIIMALGEHWLRNETYVRDVLLESDEDVFKVRDRKVRDVVEEAHRAINAENANVPRHKLDTFFKYVNKDFNEESVGQTVMMLADDKTGRSKEEIKKKFPLAEWRREIIEGSDATAKGEDHNQDYDSDGKRNSVDHVLGMSEKCGEVIRNTGIEISDVIERIFRQRLLELEEFTDVFKNYLRLEEDAETIHEWYQYRDQITYGCIHDMLDKLDATYEDVPETDLDNIGKLLGNHFKDLKATHETKGSIEGDPKYAYVGKSDQIRAAFDDIVSTFTPQQANGAVVVPMSERMLHTADKILDIFSVDGIVKEEKYNQRIELIESEREECEILFKKVPHDPAGDGDFAEMATRAEQGHFYCHQQVYTRYRGQLSFHRCKDTARYFHLPQRFADNTAGCVRSQENHHAGFCRKDLRRSRYKSRPLLSSASIETPANK